MQQKLTVYQDNKGLEMKPIDISSLKKIIWRQRLTDGDFATLYQHIVAQNRRESQDISKKKNIIFYFSLDVFHLNPDILLNVILFSVAI